MKKAIWVLLISLISCSKTDIQIEYIKIQKNWILDTAEFLQIGKEDIESVNFGYCKVSRKQSKMENFGCIAPINSLEIGERAISFSILPNNQINFSDVIDTNSNFTEFAKPIETSDITKKLKQELIGKWIYEVNEDLLILKNGDKLMRFKTTK